MARKSDEPIVILGAGPAGLAAAHDLLEQGERPIVLERGEQPGGIARTVEYEGYGFDVGGHRFFTKFRRIDRLWRDLMGDDFIKVPRRSRIYYRDRFFDYPLNVGNALKNLGLIESGLIGLSYMRARLLPSREEETFEEWVSNRFGKRLFRTFFKTYTEKVWGIPCREIRADWAAQRIKGLSLTAAVANALFKRRSVKSLIDEFDYPKRGPGMMWERFSEKIRENGGEVRLGTAAVGVHHENGRVRSVILEENGARRELDASHVISSVPVTLLAQMLEPAAPAEVLEAARGFSYRAFVMVGLIVEATDLFDDQWIYVHSPDVQVGRIQNFRNWSPWMVPDPERAGIGMEYFCSMGDAIWNAPDEELIALAAKELEALGLAPASRVVDGHVVRQPRAYPVYDEGYQERLEVLRRYLEGIENLQTVGRNGMHRYNNMDHSMVTGILAAENVRGAKHDLWGVNEEEEYLEEIQEPKPEPPIPDAVLERAFARMDKLAFAAAVGIVSGSGAFLATVWLLIRGGEKIGPKLQLLSQFFMGYSVTLEGALVAFVYSFVSGFLLGWLFAYVRNAMLALYVYRVKRVAERWTVWDVVDEL